MDIKPSIWFPTIRTNTGTDIFTEQLVNALNIKGFHAEITWLPHHAEFLPWLVPSPKKPNWANIVHVNSWLAPKFIPKSLPIISTVHLCVQDPIFNPYKSYAQYLYHKFWVTPIERQVLKRSDIVTSVSLYTKEKVENFFDIKNVELVYNGINLEIFKYKSTTYKNKPFKLLFAGSNSKRKGFDLLPLIMEKLGDEYELIFTSNDSKSLTYFPKNIKAIPYCKSQDEMVDLYHNVDALIFPSRLEGFGLVVAEAMACGLPVVIADSSALTELVDHGKTGFLCTKDDINAFVEAIRQLAYNKALQKNIAYSARQYAEQHFQIDRMVENYIKIYKKMLISNINKPPH